MSGKYTPKFENNSWVFVPLHGETGQVKKVGFDTHGRVIYTVQMPEGFNETGILYLREEEVDYSLRTV